MAQDAGGVGAEKEILRLWSVRAEKNKITFDLFAQVQDFLIGCLTGDDVPHLNTGGNVLLGEGVKLLLAFHQRPPAPFLLALLETTPPLCSCRNRG